MKKITLLGLLVCLLAGSAHTANAYWGRGGWGWGGFGWGLGLGLGFPFYGYGYRPYYPAYYAAPAYRPAPYGYNAAIGQQKLEQERLKTQLLKEQLDALEKKRAQ